MMGFVTSYEQTSISGERNNDPTDQIPGVTLDDLESHVIFEGFHTATNVVEVPGHLSNITGKATTLTHTLVCTAILANGIHVTSEMPLINPFNFDEEGLKKTLQKEVRSKIVEHVKYHRAQSKYEQAVMEEANITLQTLYNQDRE